MFIERDIVYAAGAFLIAVWILVSSRKNFSKKLIGKNIFVILYIIYITVVVSITLFPIVFEQEMVGVPAENQIKLIPFDTIILFIRYGDLSLIFTQIFGNVIMTIPFGLAAPLLFRFGELKAEFWKYFLISLLFPISIETAQLVMDFIVGCMYRTVDVDDIILNFLGIWTGYFLYSVFPKKFIDFFKGEGNLA